MVLPEPSLEVAWCCLPCPPRLKHFFSLYPLYRRMVPLLGLVISLHLDTVWGRHHGHEDRFVERPRFCSYWRHHRSRAKIAHQLLDLIKTWKFVMGAFKNAAQEMKTGVRIVVYIVPLGRGLCPQQSKGSASLLPVQPLKDGRPHPSSVAQILSSDPADAATVLALQHLPAFASLCPSRQCMSKACLQSHKIPVSLCTG